MGVSGGRAQAEGRWCVYHWSIASTLTRPQTWAVGLSGKSVKKVHLFPRVDTRQ